MVTVQTTTAIAGWRRDRARRGSGREFSITTDRLYRWILTVSAVLALFRGTQMWFGYPTSQEEFDGLNPLPMQVIVYLLVLLDLAALALRPRPLLKALTRSNPFLAIAMISVVVSIVFSQDVPASLRGIAAVLAMTLPVLLYYFEFGGDQMQALLRRWAMFVVVVNILYTVAAPHYGIMSGSLDGAMRGMFLHKNLFGQYLALMLVIFVGSAIGPSLIDRSRLVDMAFAGITLALVVLSHSSTGVILIVAGLAGLGMNLVFGLFPQQRMKQLAVFVAMFAILWMVLLGGPLLLNEVVGSTGKDLTFSGRTRIWNALLPHIWDYPLTGHGFSMFRNVYYIHRFTERLSAVASSTHNTYIELLLTIGIPGTIAWVLFIFARLFTKLATVAQTPALRAARSQEATIIFMAMIGSTMEAGQVLAPLAIWPVLAACLPLGRVDPTQR